MTVESGSRCDPRPRHSCLRLCRLPGFARGKAGWTQFDELRGALPRTMRDLERSDVSVIGFGIFSGRPGHYFALRATKCELDAAPRPRHAVLAVHENRGRMLLHFEASCEVVSSLRSADDPIPVDPPLHHLGRHLRLRLCPGTARRGGHAANTCCSFYSRCFRLHNTCRKERAVAVW